MKKVNFIVVALLMLTACNIEPIDSGLSGEGNGNGNGNGNGGGSNAFDMSTYAFNTDSTLPIFGQIIVNSDFNINADNVVSSLDVATTFFGSTINETATIARNSSGQITSVTSSENVTTVTYNSGNITQIAYDDLMDDSEDYVFSFTHSGNVITRTSDQNSVQVTYVFDGATNLVSKTTQDGGSTTFAESLSYSNGNCTLSVVTGSENLSTNYGYDTNTNPLKSVFNDQFLLTILDSEDEESVASVIVQFHSSNNWSNITSDGTTVNFTIQLDSDNRITSRGGNYDLGDGVVINQNETFSYSN